ncbi:nitroreductase family protein [Tenacibaculum aiptasiae]|uniref:nitroreductase family protein n=1 Tax=Tenacibaculum aiptasiae TaxID=426481 RepID=UPI00232DD43B|nr:nitroreductase [Tenacibaculum aiptasiae]
MNFEELTKVIHTRKSTYAYDYANKKIEKETIEAIVTNALWAPTHLVTQPWRFVVLEGKHQLDLSEFMASYYRELYTEKQFSNERYEATKTYAKNATLIGIVFTPNKKAKLSEWEELAAVSCAVQNMWLSCTSLGLGSYWDSSPATLEYGKEYVNLEKDEQFLGIFFMGYKKEDAPEPRRKRKPLSKKLSWNKKQ